MYGCNNQARHLFSKEGGILMRFYLVLVFFFMWLVPVAVSAHPLGEVVQETTIMNEGEQLLMGYSTSIGPSITATLVPDSNHDGKVSVHEEAQLSRAIHEILHPNLEVYIDEKSVVPELYYDSVAPAPGVQ